MRLWRNLLLTAAITTPKAVLAAAPIYFDLGGLVLTALAVLLGLILLVVSLVSRSRSLGALGGAFIVLPLIWVVAGPVLEDRRREADRKVYKADEDEHQTQFAAFCSQVQQPVQMLSSYSIKDVRAALMVKCNDEKNMGLCYALDERLQRRFNNMDGVGCRDTSVGAIYREFRDLSAPCCKQMPSVIVPVCGAGSRDPNTYRIHHLLTRVLRSEHHDGKGPMSRAHFFEIELTLMDASTATPLFRSRSAGLLDYKEPPICPSFEDAAVGLEKAVLEHR